MSYHKVFHRMRRFRSVLPYTRVVFHGIQYIRSVLQVMAISPHPPSEAGCSVSSTLSLVFPSLVSSLPGLERKYTCLLRNSKTDNHGKAILRLKSV